jgi:hypothetical protein
MRSNTAPVPKPARPANNNRIESDRNRTASTAPLSPFPTEILQVQHRKLCKLCSATSEYKYCNIVKLSNAIWKNMYCNIEKLCTAISQRVVLQRRKNPPWNMEMKTTQNHLLVLQHLKKVISRIKISYCNNPNLQLPFCNTWITLL